MGDGTGFTPVWGFSPALDFRQLMRTTEDDDSSYASAARSARQVLMVNPGDIRHVLKTIARRRRWVADGEEKTFHLYILERDVATLARDMLLLSVFCDWSVPLRRRANTFLEIFGNALVQERTESYVDERSRHLIEVLCNEKGFLSKVIDTSLLKYKVKDELETIFISYRTTVPFDAANLHDHRQRGLLKSRYDARLNVYDWDYERSIRPSASIVHIKQYRKWRKDGIAFEFGDQTYTLPNRTLASYAEGHARDGGAKLVRGFWGDIVNSPYPALGIECDTPNVHAENLFRVLNKGSGAEQHRHNATEIAVYNLLSFMHEVETGKVYKMQKSDDIYSGMGKESDSSTTPNLSATKEKSNRDDSDKCCDSSREDDSDTAMDEETAAKRARCILESFRGVKVHLLRGSLDSIAKKSRFKDLFDCVYLSNTSVHHLAPSKVHDLKHIMRNDEKALLICETARHMVPLSKDQRASLCRKVHQMAQCSGFMSLLSEKDGPPSDVEHLLFRGSRDTVVDTKDLDDVDE